MSEPFKGNKFKYTESELKDRGCGKMYDARTDHQQWNIKKATYTNEGVWNVFTTLRDSFRALLRNADGFVIPERAHNDAQIMMDAFLIRRSKGENVFPPKEVVPVNAAPDEKVVGLLENLNDGSNVSENEKIKWVYENMESEGATQKTAPSDGTWAYLQRCRSNEKQKENFYNNQWPKLLVKEDAEKGGKLQDNGEEVIKLIERLQEAIE